MSMVTKTRALLLSGVMALAIGLSGGANAASKTDIGPRR